MSVFRLTTSPHQLTVSSRRVDLAKANLPQLVHLLSSCKPLGEEDVLEGAFRKAGQLEEFSTKFDPTQSGILHVATKELTEVKEGQIQVELDGFYVYGL